ncbi:MAG: prepilin-type N-terminal cleavage/methylation domain-containing protein [Halioglobus sp.]|nr:prepilin-type N-terminal cleavage/methylation domain-containing protein [Halioglobus sp.]
MADQKRSGFTLIELLVVIVLAVTLLALTLPAYQQQLRDTRRSLAGAALLETMTRQEQYFLDHKRYAESLTELAYPTHPYAVDAHGSVVDGMAENRVYLINLTTRANAFTLHATPQLGQAADSACGILSLDSNGAKLVSGENPGARCW